MSFQFILNYPWWFMLLCIMAGGLVTGILYYKNKADVFTLLQKRLLAIFRFLVISLLCFFLLSPLLKMQITQTQEPIILFFQDNSQSLTIGGDSTFIQDQYREKLDGFLEELRSDYTLNTYSFGEMIAQTDTFDFKDKATDISEVFSTLETHYNNRNLGAVIIASDGIYNRGRNPQFLSAGSYTPVYTLALGDTLAHRDLIINRLAHNRITFLNNIFPLEITLEARQASGLNSRLRVMHEGNTVFEQNIAINSDNFFTTIPVQLEATEVGIKRYRVEIDPVPDEITLANNRQDFFIEVIDSRQKVLIIAHAPHPDVGALKLALEDNENYEVEVVLLNDFSGNLQEFNLVIWHQLPSGQRTGTSLINQARNANMPQLFILGSQTNIAAFNRAQTGVQIAVRSAGFNDARAEINTTFNLFQTTEDISRLLPQLPPLNTVFATYNLSPGSQVFAYQRIGAVSTQHPLIVFTESNERKTGIITGEGIWRWRLNNFAREGNHNAFNHMVSSMIQFLSVVEDKSFFRLNTRNFLFENEPAIFEAELYNRSYELVNEPEVSLAITNHEGVSFDYIFGKTSKTYNLNAGVFPVGEYRYAAAVSYGGEHYKAEGIFTVSPLSLEGISTLANHNLLFQMAENTDAAMYYPDQLDQLLQDLRNREDIKPMLFTQHEFEDLINLRWIFFLLLVLLSAEWFIRKYAGSY